MKIFDRIDACLRLPEHEQMVLESVQALARDRIAPRAEHYDRTAAFPWEHVEAINALGLNGMFVPQEYGGAGLSYAVYLACVREISKACAATGIIWATNFHAIKPLIDFGNEGQKKRILPKIVDGALASLCITEPTAGSDATGMKTRFEQDGDEIVVTGNKTFITNGPHSAVMIVFGKWAGIEDSKRSISALVLERGNPGLSVLREEDKMGIRASSTATLAFEGYRVPRENLLGEPGDGLKILLGSLNKSRPSVAAHALGIARAAFEEGVGYINERRQSGRRIAEFQGIQFMVADMATELAQCEAWLWYVARLVDEGVTDFGMEASMLKMRAADVAVKLATDAVQFHGGYGFCKDYKVERLYRDAKITQIWEGTNQIHRQLIGRSFMNK